jgi:hypothetical protein
MASQPPALRELQPQDVLLRAILSSKALDNPPDAFLLRTNEKESGLSVSFDSTPAECRALFSRTYGIFSLRVAQVTDLHLQVIPDEPNHANIKGLPYKEDNPDLAEWYAGQLAERATLVERGKVQNP